MIGDEKISHRLGEKLTNIVDKGLESKLHKVFLKIQ